MKPKKNNLQKSRPPNAAPLPKRPPKNADKQLREQPAELGGTLETLKDLFIASFPPAAEVFTASVCAMSGCISMSRKETLRQQLSGMGSIARYCRRALLPLCSC